MSKRLSPEWVRQSIRPSKRTQLVADLLDAVEDVVAEAPPSEAVTRLTDAFNAIVEFADGESSHAD